MLRRSLTIVTAPSVEPVTVDELKLFARIDGDDEDDLLDEFIQTARVAAENYTRRSFITQSHRLTLDIECNALDNLPEGTYDAPPSAFTGSLPNSIRLPKPPLIAVTSVTTYDSNANASLFTDYYVTPNTQRLTLNPSASWPTDLRISASTEIVYTAGYGATATAVPSPIRTAIKMHAARLYETRGQCGCDTPADCQSLLQQYRIMDS